jgi:hypothetical protein
VPNCAKPEQDEARPTDLPLITVCDALIRLGVDVSSMLRSRRTLPAVPSAIARRAGPPDAP